MIADILNGLQRDVFKSLIDELYRLEEENTRLRARIGGGAVVSNGGYDNSMSQEEVLRHIKHEVFGDPLYSDDER